MTNNVESIELEPINVNDDGDGCNEQNAAAWASEKKIQCRKCTRFVPKGENTTETQADKHLCYCGYSKVEHDDTATSNQTSTEAWTIQNDTECCDTNAVGEMKFDGFNQKSAQYIRVEMKTNVEDVWALMTKVWRPKPPCLVISVTGGAKSLSLAPRLKDVFRKGLIKAALSTDAWIISGGTNEGVMKYVGEAVQKYTAGKSLQNRVIALGVATWGCVHNKESLINTSKTSKQGRAQYKIEDSINSTASLDSNHTHFILVDNGTQHKYGVEIPFRAELEKKISSDREIPIILVVVEGGPGTLQTVYSSIENKTPALIVAGSGRIANVLVYAIDNAIEHQIVEVDDQGKKNPRTILIMSDQDENEVKTRLRDALEKRKSLTKDELNKYVDWIKFCLLYPHLLSVFRLDSSNSAKEIDVEILKGLLKANHEDVFSQLQLAMIWNRIDVAKTDIITNDKIWKDERLPELLLNAVHLDHVDFVKLILENLDISLKKLDNLFCNHLKENEWKIDERLLKKITGDWYSPRKCENEPERHERDLFLWCVLKGRCEMAKLLWEKRRDALPLALTAYSMSKSIKHQTADTEKKEKFRANALEFQQLAVGVIKECYNEDEGKTRCLLERPLMSSKDTTCVDIAFRSKNKAFIAQPACQHLFNRIWWGNLPGCSRNRFMAEASKQNKNAYSGVVASEDSPPDSWQKFQAFFKSPAAKFCYNVLSFLAFLLLYSYVMLARFHHSHVSVSESILIVWVITMLLEEIRQLATSIRGSLWTKLKHYHHHTWNILDVVTILGFAIGIILRLMPNRDAFEAARLILAVNLFTFFVRLLPIFSVNKLMGPKLVMIGKMFGDLLSFVLILLVFIVGYAIMTQSILYPNAELEPTIIIDVLRKAYWQMFGELFLEEIEGKGECTNGTLLYSSGEYDRCPSEVGKWMVPILLALYMLLTNILLMNLLIAIFSNTYQKVQDNTDKHWHFQRYKMVQEYVNKPILPPPFIIICHVYEIYQSLCGTNAGDGVQYDGEELDGFEERNRDEFVSQTDKITLDIIHCKVSSVMDRVDTLIAKTDDFQRNTQDRINSLESKMMKPGRQNTVTRDVANEHPQVARQPSQMPINHPKARSSPYPGTYVDRFEVPDDHVKWEKTFVYRPPSYTTSTHADCSDKVELGHENEYNWNSYDHSTGIDRNSYQGRYSIRNGYPVNPFGRTGLTGRGNLRRWGPNHAGDAIITRWKQDGKGETETRENKPVLEFIAVKRKDNKHWSLPGAFIQAKEYFLATVQRSFVEDALGDSMDNPEMTDMSDGIFKNGENVYIGYLDDAKNTDNAWIETKAVNYHDEDGTLTKTLPLKAGENVEAVAWLPVWPNIPMQTNHVSILKEVATKRNAAF